MQNGERQSAEDVLADVPHWRLKPAGWHAVGQALQAMQRTLAAGDPAGLRRAVADLEMVGPYRIAGLQDADNLPVPQEHRERVNELIHTLGATSAQPPQTAVGPRTPTPGVDGAAARDADAEGRDAAG